MGKNIAELSVGLDTSGFLAGVENIKRSTQGVTDAAKKTTDAVSMMESAVRKLAAAFGIYQASSWIKQSIELAARYETLGVVLNRVGKQAGYTQAGLNGLTESLRAQGITMNASRQSMVSMINANISLVRASELARVAQNAAVVGNMNSSEAFERMVHGIETGNTMILRTLGLTTSFESAYSKLAQTLNKTTEQLTTAERAQARANAVIEAGKNIVGAYESAMGTAGKQMNSMQRYVEDFRVNFGLAFQPMYTALVFAAAAAMKLLANNITVILPIVAVLAARWAMMGAAALLAKVSLTGVAGAMMADVGAAVALTASVTSLSGAVTLLNMTVSSLFARLAAGAVAMLANPYVLLTVAVMGLAAAFTSWYTASVRVNQAMADNSDAIAERLKKISEAAKENVATMTTWREGFGMSSAALAQSASSMASYQRQQGVLNAKMDTSRKLVMDSYTSWDRMRLGYRAWDAEAQRVMVSMNKLHLQFERGNITGSEYLTRVIALRASHSDFAPVLDKTIGTLAMYVNAQDEVNASVSEMVNPLKENMLLMNAFGQASLEMQARIRGIADAAAGPPPTFIDDKLRELREQNADASELTPALASGNPRAVAAAQMEIDARRTLNTVMRETIEKNNDLSRLAGKSLTELQRIAEGSVALGEMSKNAFRDQLTGVVSIRTEATKYTEAEIEGAQKLLAGNKALSTELDKQKKIKMENDAAGNIDATRESLLALQRDIVESEAKLADRSLPAKIRDLTAAYRNESVALGERERLMIKSFQGDQRAIAVAKERFAVLRQLSAEHYAYNTAQAETAQGLDEQEARAVAAEDSYAQLGVSIGRMRERLKGMPEEVIDATAVMMTENYNFAKSMEEAGLSAKALGDDTAQLEVDVAQMRRQYREVAPEVVDAYEQMMRKQAAFVVEQRKVNTALQAMSDARDPQNPSASRGTDYWEAVDAAREQLNIVNDGLVAFKAEHDIRNLTAADQTRYNQLLTEQRSLYQALNADALSLSAATKKALEEQAEAHREIMEEAVRGVQGTFSAFFNGLLTSGTSVFQQLADAFRGIFTKMLSALVTENFMKKFGDSIFGTMQTRNVYGHDADGTQTGVIGQVTERMGGLFGSGGWAARHPNLMRAGGAAIAGVGAGVAGYQSGDAISSTLMGAVGGGAAGGVWGAVAGGVMGLIGGLMGMAEKAKQKAREMQQAETMFVESMDSLRRSVEGTANGVHDQIMALRETMKQLNALADKANSSHVMGQIAPGDQGFDQFLKELKDELAMRKQNPMVRGRSTGTVDQLEGYIKDIEAAAKLYQAALKKLGVDTLRAINEGYADAIGGVDTSQERAIIENMRKQQAAILDLYAERIISQAEYEDAKFKIEQTGLAALKKIDDEKIRSLAAFNGDLDARALAATVGGAQAAEDLRRQINNENELNAALEKHYDTTKLLIVQTLEQEAIDRQRLRETRNASAELGQRLLVAVGKPREAALAAAELARLNEIEAAEERFGKDSPYVQHLRLVLDAEKELAAARLLEADLRVTEGLNTRALTAIGDTRGAENAAFAAQQRQELADAVAAGMTDTNLAFLRFVQFAEASALQMRQAIEDGTKAINDLANSQIADIDLLIEATTNSTKAYTDGIDRQIDAITAQTKAQVEALDAQVEAAQDALAAAQDQVSVLSDIVNTNRKVVEALQQFTDSLKLGGLSILSPEQKLAEARAQFDAMAASALSGNSDAAAGLGNAGQAYLEASRGYNASNAGYVSDYTRVLDMVNSVNQQYSATLPMDEQLLAAAERQVEGLQSTIDALNNQRDEIRKASDAQISALNVLKTDANDKAQKTIAALNDQKKAIRTEADRQIQTLIDNETAAHRDRLHQNAYWETFLGVSVPVPLLEKDTPTSGTKRTTTATTKAVTIPEQQLDAQKKTTEVLTAKLDALLEQVAALTSVSTAASGEEVKALSRVETAVDRVASATISTGQLVAARSTTGQVRR